MLIDLLSMDNYISFNVKVADVLGLNEAVYLSELMNINEKAIRKSTVVDNFFTIDRAYLTKRTTLTKEQQLKIDKFFSEIGILTIDPENHNAITLNISVLTKLLDAEEGEDTIKQLKDNRKAIQKLKSNNKMTKEQQSCEEMKTYILTDNTELYEAYCDWIDSVFSKLHWMSAKSVKVGQKLVDEASGRDLDIALKIIEIATVNGYKDMTWAVKTYKENYELNYRLKYSKNKISNQKEKISLDEEVF